MKRVIPIIMFLSIGLMGCEEKEDIEAISKQLSEHKTALEDVYLRAPFGEEEHRIISGYFRSFIKHTPKLASLVSKGESVGGSSSKKKKLKKEFKRLCESIVVRKSVWEATMDSCQLGGYFLCNEELRFYPKVLKKLLSVDQNALGEVCSEWAE